MPLDDDIKESAFQKVDDLFTSNVDGGKVKGKPVPEFASDQFYKAADSVSVGKLAPKDAAKQVHDTVQAEVKNRFPNGVQSVGFIGKG